MKKKGCGAALLGLAMGLGGVGHAETWAEGRILLGQAALQEQHYTNATAYFTEALQVDTRNRLAQRGLQQALAQEAAIDPMRDQSEITTLAYARQSPHIPSDALSLEMLANVAPETPDALQKRSLLALAQLQHGDNMAAMRTARPLPKRYGHPTAWNMLGLAQYSMGDTIKAKQAFNQALELNPSFHAARLNLASVFMTGGDFKNAEEQITWVLTETQFKHNQALLSMSTLKNLEGDKAAAATWAARASGLL